MGIQINLSGVKISDDAKLMNGAKIRSHDDVNIELDNIEINGRAIVLDDLEIDTILEELDKKARVMNIPSNEYQEIQKILNMERGDSKNIFRCIGKHIGEFSQGVLVNIISNFLTQRM